MDMERERYRYEGRGINISLRLKEPFQKKTRKLNTLPIDEELKGCRKKGKASRQIRRDRERGRGGERDNI